MSLSSKINEVFFTSIIVSEESSNIRYAIKSEIDNLIPHYLRERLN